MPRAPSEPARPAVCTSAPWFVYLLECEDGSLYTGVALDVQARFIKHALGLGAAYTRAHPPLRILACRCLASKSEALRLEYALKQIPRERKLNFFDAAEQLADACLPDMRRPAAKPQVTLGENAPARLK
jgi:putative endonuclease